MTSNLDISLDGLNENLLAFEHSLSNELDLARGPSNIHIVSAPRTGSTLIYQLLAKFGHATYISNFVNRAYNNVPFLGLLYQDKLLSYENRQGQISLSSSYGKTENIFDTSEASETLMHWFGGGHPSEVVSNGFVDDISRQQFVRVTKSIASYYDYSLVIKNPWNSFRVDSILKADPNSIIIWIRRSIEHAALSDLENRYKVGDPNEVWNSATVRDYREIQKRPYWEQVVLQQLGYTRAISEAVSQHPSSAIVEIWYEDLVNNIESVFSDLISTLNSLGAKLKCDIEAIQSSLIKKTDSKKVRHSALESDFSKIKQFIESDRSLQMLTYDGQ